MRIKDIGIILAKKKMQEKSAIVTVFTKEHGIYTGFVTNITGKSSGAYQIGNMVDFFWQARLDEHIGHARCEIIKSSAVFINNKYNLYALNSLLNIILVSLKERIQYTTLFELCSDYLYSRMMHSRFIDYILLEQKILENIGYGLDLTSCAVTGKNTNLIYVSPKSGRAVSRVVGEDYKDKLLNLPLCLLNHTEPKSIDEVRQISELMLYFFQRYVFGKYEPESRNIFIQYVIDSYSK